MSSNVELTTDLPKAKLSKRWHWASEQSISFLMQQGVENPDVISLAAGLVDPASLPVEETRTAVERLLTDDQQARLPAFASFGPQACSLAVLVVGHFTFQ